MAPVSLARHLVLSNNVRGLAVYDPEAPPDREVFTWLSRKHQYRNVGFGPTHFEHPDVDLSDYKTFTGLEYPRSALRDLQDRCPDTRPPWVYESLLLASAYVVPLFVHRPAVEHYRDLAAWVLEADGPLSEDQVLRHMRIAGYGMVDCFAETTERALSAIERGAVAEERERRREVAAADGRDRFWRLIDEESGGDGRLAGGYFDVLAALGERDGPDLPQDPDVAIGLGLVGGFAVDPPYSD